MITIVRIKCDNDAFANDASSEVARILRTLAERIDGHPHFSPGFSQPLRDANGNSVGYLDVHDLEPVVGRLNNQKGA